MAAAFLNLWNFHNKIKLQNNLQLPNGTPTYVFYFPEQCDGIQIGIQITSELLQEAFTQSGISIDNGSTAFNFVNEDFLRDCEHFLPDFCSNNSNL